MSTPPNIDRIKDTDSLRQIIEQIRDGQTKLADYLNNLGAAAHPDLVELLIAEGVDVRGSFGRSSAEKTAKAFHQLLKRTADHADTTAKVADAAFMYWLKNVRQPIEAARARKSGKARINI